MSDRRWKAIAAGVLIGATIALTAQSMGEWLDAPPAPSYIGETSDS